jgi:hypothetical protein
MKTRCLRVDGEVYSAIMQRKVALERERGRPVSITQALRDLLQEVNAMPVAKEPAPEEMVLKEEACPHCGERRVDQLILREVDSVECLSCGNRYSLSVEKEQGPTREGGGQA